MAKGKTRVLTSFVQNTAQPLHISSSLDTLMLCNTSGSDITVTMTIGADKVEADMLSNYILPANSILDVLDGNPMNMYNGSMSIKVTSAVTGLTVVYTAV